MLYNLVTKEVFISRDVVFDDQGFPFKDTNPTHSTGMFSMPTFVDEPFEDELSPLPNTPLPPDSTTPTLTTHNPSQDTFIAALVYVDDVLITRDSEAGIVHLKQALDKKFTIKDLGIDKYFLGIELCCTSTGTHLNQRKYIVDLLSNIGLTNGQLSLCLLIEVIFG
ncbi:retrovirus-related pol polyprotein from transposon TNT 1-94 [Tanacetum coccineum]